MSAVSDYEKDRLSAIAKYSDSVYQLDTLKGNGEFYMNVMNLFLVLIALVLLHNIGLFTAYMLYLSLFIVSIAGLIYIISKLNYNKNKQDRGVYDQIIFKNA